MNKGPRSKVQALVQSFENNAIYKVEFNEIS